MRILINGSNLRIGGGIQVGNSFINEIRSNFDHEFYIILSKKLEKTIKKEYFPKNFHIFLYDSKPTCLKVFKGFDRYLTKMEKEFQIDRVFTIFGPSYWRPISKHICGFAKAQYIYKDSPFFDHITIVQRIKLNIKKIFHLHSFKKHVDVYITENEDVSKKLKLLINNKPVFTVTNTYNQIFDNPEIWDKTINLEPFKGITILTISANYPHKNLKIIPEIIDYLKEKRPEFKFRFVISVAPFEVKQIKKKHINHVVFLGELNIYQCPFLYQQVDIMFLPTLLECFSASYPEAMKMKVPIITTDLPFARKICDNAAIYFNPLSAEDAGDKIFDLSNNTQQAEKLKLNGQQRLAYFDNPTKRAKKYLQIITDETNNPIL